ncbi:hypothetical protein QW180_23910 [Vibrio sinaloensis]|nr:hypothetical protein [Vibrio sinaloensis]
MLFEILPAGQSSIEEVAAKLAISKRTLQRKTQSRRGEFSSFAAIGASRISRSLLREITHVVR